MAASRLIILGVAVAAAGGAGYVAKNMMAAPPPEVIVQQGPQAPAIELTDVLVLEGDVPMGAPVGDQLTWQSWPSDGVNENFITRDSDPEALDTYKGSVARLAMFAGEPLRKSKLIGEGQSFMSSILPTGYRAVATQIAADTSAGGFILPGDRVDVLLTRETNLANMGAQEGDRSKFASSTVMQNIKVLAIDQSTRAGDDEQAVVGATATLEVGPRDAEALALAKSEGELSLVLRSYADTGGPSGRVAPVARQSSAIRVYRGGAPEVVVVQ